MKGLFGMRDPLMMLAMAEHQGVLKLVKMEIDPKETRDHFRTLLKEAIEEQVKQCENAVEIYTAKKDDPSSEKAQYSARRSFIGDNAEYIENLERAIKRINEACFKQDDGIAEWAWSRIDDLPLQANPFVTDMNDFVKNVIKSCSDIEEKRRNQKHRERLAQISVSREVSNG